MMDTTNGPGFVLSGYRYGSGTNWQNGRGIYWSSTAYSAYYAYYLYLDSSSVNHVRYGDKYSGNSVRCVAQ